MTENLVDLTILMHLPDEAKLQVAGGQPTTAKQVKAFINNPHFQTDKEREDYLTAKRYYLI